MEYWEKLKQTYSGEATSVVPQDRPPAEAIHQESGWSTFVESMDQARQRAGGMFTVPQAAETVEEPAADPAAGITSTVKSWWEEAANYMEEAKISVEEKLSEITGPSEIKNDPLRKLKEQLLVYTDALEALKSESFNFAMSAETMARLGGAKSINPAFAHNVLHGDAKNILVPCSVPDVYERYSQLHANFLAPALDEVRHGSETVTAMVTEELAKIQAIQTRFKRRDRLHKTLLDMRARVGLRREKNNRKLAEGMSVEAKAMEELYELTRSMDSTESDFRITSEQLVSKCSELLSNRSKSYMRIVLRLIEIQNAFFYRVSNFCSVPFQELVESIRTHELPLDELEDLGPHALTWRSQPNSDQEEHDQPSPPVRRSSVDIIQESPTGGLSPSKYSYRRERPAGLPIRRAGTTALP